MQGSSRKVFLVYAFDGCCLDPARVELRRDGEPVHVEPQVFDVLAFLVVHRDRVVTKTELLDRVWDARGGGYEPNNVEVYVGYLRRKLGPGLIETVRGAGYRLAR